MQVIVYPKAKIDAVELIQEVLDSGIVVMKNYGDGVLNYGEILDYAVEEANDSDTDFSTMEVTINYMKRNLGDNPTNKQLRLQMLSSIGDRHWTSQMVMLLFKGLQPSTVAIDKDTGDIYLVYLKTESVGKYEFTLEYFAKMEVDILEDFFEELDVEKPYTIGIQEDNMIDFIDKSEGLRGLRKGLKITFHGGIPAVYEVGEGIEGLVD